MDNLLRTIQNQLNSFSKGQQRIARYILESYEQAAFMTAARLGETVGVSESTVVRFAYALGLEGYPALQDRLQELVLGHLTSVQRARLADRIPRDQVFSTVLNTDINAIRHDVLRRHISIVLQEPFLYSRSILDNIRIVDPAPP